MRAGLYARVSTEEQLEGYSVDEQLAAMHRFCRERGWSVAAEYTELGVSGTTDNRPALQAALANAQAGRFDVLLTHKLDRFYRNLQLQLETLGRLGLWQVGYLSVTEQIDYSTPQGMLFMQMLGAFNEYYSANLSREVAKGKRGRAKAGLSNAGMLCAGYVRVDGKEVPNEETAAAVRLAFEAYATGEYTDQQIADLLIRQGHIPPRGITRGRWCRDTIRYMLRNRFYIGEVRYRREWLPGQHEPIISRELFERVQEARERRRSRSPGRLKTGRVYLLQGIIRCRDCGLPMHVSRVSEREKVLVYYRDSAQIQGLPCPMAGRHVPADVIDRQVGELVKRLRLPDDWRDRLAEMAAHREERGNTEGKRQYLKEKLKRLRDCYVDGDYTKGEYVPLKKGLQAELAALRDPKSPAVEEAGAMLEGLADLWDGAPVQWRAEMLRTVFEVVVIDAAARRLVCVKPWPQFAPLLRMDGLEEREDGYFYVGEE